MKTKQQDKFNFFIPLDFEKSNVDGKELVKIKGVCSTDAEDSDGETLIPSGFDFAPLLDSGFLNWNHQAKTTSSAICGEPTAAAVIDNGKSFYIEGVLYPNAEGKRIAELAETLEKHSTTRRLGFSIEGQALERDILNRKKVLRARITGVAITQSPKNPNTLMNIMKGEYEEGFQDEDKEEEKDEVDKAMMVDPNINPPSIEGTVKKDPLKDELKKSYIYNQIYNRYTTDPNRAEQIYDFINKVKEKGMKTDNITPEVLEKALSILDESLLEKGGEGKTLDDYDKKDEVVGETEGGETEEKSPDGTGSKIEKGEDKEEEEDDFDKAMCAETIAKSLFDQGMDKDEVTKAMTGCGVNLSLVASSVDNCIAQANAKKNGGDVTVLKKGEDEDLSEGNESFDRLASMIDRKFGAVGTILKSMTEEQSALLGKVSTLEKSNADLNQELNKLSNAPQGRKSITNQQVLERFEKSNDGASSGNTYNSQNVNDMRRLSDVLYQEVSLIKSRGQEDTYLEKAVADLEIAKTTDFRRIGAQLRHLNIQVV